MSVREMILTYQEAKNCLGEKLDGIRNNFIAAGFYMKYIRDNELYLEDGYKSIWEFAETCYGIKRSTASRWMSMNDRFSQDGNSPVLSDRYLSFEKSQLQEMLYLDDKQIDTVTPDMTVKEIREVRKPQEPQNVLKKPDETDQEYLNMAAKYMIQCWKKWFLRDFENRVLQVERSPEEIKRKIRAQENNNRTYYFTIQSHGVAHINLFDDYVQIWDKSGKCLGNFEWFYFAAAIQSMWNIVAMEELRQSAESVATSQQDTETEDQLPGQMAVEDFPELLPDQDVVVDSIVVEETDDAKNIPGKTSEEPYEEISPLSDLEILQEELRKTQNYLRLAKEEFTEKDIRIRRQKLLIGALTNMIAELESDSVTEMEQPELPILQNNDQRKEWLRSYKSWGLWYEDKNIGAKYFKYDFDNGARLIAEVYVIPADKWSAEYQHCYLHLIGGPEPPRDKTGCVPKWQRHEYYNRFPNNETELVEFLKYIQREGK